MKVLQEWEASMKLTHIDLYTKGWFLGNFVPTFVATEDFEVAFKVFKAGEIEHAHKQLVATEITLFTNGIGLINNHTFSRGDIIQIEAGEVADFRAVTDCELVCIKMPSIPLDKIVVA
jgi:hypothetical protein